MFYYQITPTPAPRQVRRDAWNPSPSVQRYRAYRDEIRVLRITMPERPRLLFLLPMPRSWSARKREQLRGMPHRAKPDADNLTKAIKDATLGEDSQVWDEHATKFWWDHGGLFIADMDRDTIPTIVPLPFDDLLLRVQRARKLQTFPER